MFVIHIGLKKSGSASIQNFLVTNEDALRSIGVDYSPIGRLPRKAHHNLASELVAKKTFNPRHGTLQQLAESSAASGYPITLVSSEMFEGCHDRAVEEIRDRLAPAGRKFRIVLVVRELVDLITSRYAQKIRYGYNNFDFDTFFTSAFHEDRSNFFETAARWANVFGWENVFVRPLDATQLFNGDLIDDFLKTVGVEMAHPLIRTLERPGVVNATGGWKTLEAIRALYSGRHGLGAVHPLVASLTQSDFGAGAKKIDAAAQEASDFVGWSRDKSGYLTLAQAQHAMDTYAKSIALLNTCVSPKLPEPRSLESRGFVERPFLPDVSRIPRLELRAFYDRLAELYFTRGKAFADAYSIGLTVKVSKDDRPALLVRERHSTKSRPRLLVEVMDFYSRNDQSLLARKFFKKNDIKDVKVKFIPPGLVSRSDLGNKVKVGTSAALSKIGRRSFRKKTFPTMPLKIVCLSDGRTIRNIKNADLQSLSHRLEIPITFEHIALPPLPILLSDVVYLDYFLWDKGEPAPFSRIASVRQTLRNADVIVIDDIAELQWPMMRSYPVISHIGERSADADLLAYRNDIYTEKHDRLPIVVVNGSSLGIDTRDVVIDAFSRVIGVPVFRIAAARALADFTKGWEFRPLSTDVGGPGQTAVKADDLMGSLGNWIESRIKDGKIRKKTGAPSAEMIGHIDFRPFDSMAADR